MKCAGTCQSCPPTPVSYTHLDVYKRQVQHNVDTVEVIVANDLPTTSARSDGHAVGLSSARERVHAMTGGRGRVDARIEAGRYLATLRLPAVSAAGESMPR